MKTLSALSIRVQLTLLAAMFVLPAAGLTVWSGLRAREERIQEARVATQKLVAAIAAAYESRLASGQQLMTTLARLPAVKRRDPAVQALLRDMVALNPTTPTSPSRTRGETSGRPRTRRVSTSLTATTSRARSPPDDWRRANT
jgi:hypothetical protein